jgi:hypothetical protein
MRYLHSATVVLSMLLCAPFIRPARAGVPDTVSFQGRLTSPNGQPVADTDSQTLTFRLYDAPTGGTLLWSQTSSSVQVRGGAFSVTLDFSTGFTAQNTLDTALGGTPYVEVQAGDDPPMLPRLPLASSPYAFRARTADLALTVPDGSITAPKLAPGAVSSAALDADLANTLGGLSVSLSGIVLVSTTDVAPLTDPRTMTLAGGRLYVAGNTADRTPALEVFDVTGPAPILLGTSPSGSMYDTPALVAVSGDKAYVGGTGLTVLDVSDPAAPTVLGSVSGEPNTFGRGVAVVGTTAYVLVESSGLTPWTLSAFDVSNPSTPTLQGVANMTTLGPDSDAYSLAVSGSLAFIATAHDLLIYDVSNPESMVKRGSVGIPTSPSSLGSLAVSNGIAYLAAGGLQIVDVSNPDNPRLLSTLSVSGNNAGAVAVVGTTAYVTGNQLSVVDASNPSVPVVLGVSSPSSLSVPALALAASGPAAYTLNHSDHTVQHFAFGRLNASRSLSVDGDADFAGDAIFAGRVGIGTTPTTRLEVNGTMKATGVDVSGTVTSTGVDVNGTVTSTRVDVAGAVKSTSLQMTSGAAAGRVLTSDASGVATWRAPAISAVVAGEVSYDAQAVRDNGSGFTVERMASYPAGGYHITFSTPFLAPPIVTATAAAVADAISATYWNVTKNDMDILITTPNGFGDAPFSFIAIGAR